MEKSELTIVPQMTDSQVDLIKRTLCKGATDDEIALFIGTAKRMGLDPLAGQIHALKRWDNTERREVMKIQTGIDGFRLVADRTGERDGEDSPVWCGEDSKWMDMWAPSNGYPVACRVQVYRKGHGHPYVGIAYWDFYAQKKRDGDYNSMWSKGGPNMLAKCAEALALRKAFPAELSGIYTSDEMQQTEVVTPEQTPATEDPARTVTVSGRQLGKTQQQGVTNMPPMEWLGDDAGVPISKASTDTIKKLGRWKEGKLGEKGSEHYDRDNRLLDALDAELARREERANVDVAGNLNEDPGPSDENAEYGMVDDNEPNF